MTFASSILPVFHICSWVCNFHIQLSFRIVLFYTSPLTTLNSVSRIFQLQSFPQEQQRLPQDYIMPQLLPLQLLLFSLLEKYWSQEHLDIDLINFLDMNLCLRMGFPRKLTHKRFQNEQKYIQNNRHLKKKNYYIWFRITDNPAHVNNALVNYI